MKITLVTIKKEITRYCEAFDFLTLLLTGIKFELMTERKKIVDKRKALLDATLYLVNNNGFHDAPMSKIAKRQEFRQAQSICTSKTNKT